jgi:hypothetical protein
MASPIIPIRAYFNFASCSFQSHNQSQKVLAMSQINFIHIMLSLTFLVFAKHFHRIPDTSVIFNHFTFNLRIWAITDLNIDSYHLNWDITDSLLKPFFLLGICL